jgi:nucleoid-associated protein YgaU
MFGRRTGIRTPDPHGKEVETMPDEPVQGKGKEEMDATQWHEVKKGDTLSKIAEKYYGDPGLYTTIFEANRDRLKDPNLIKIGQKLRIP